MKPCKKHPDAGRYENGKGDCKVCTRERSANWYAEHPKQAKQTRAKYYADNRDWIKAKMAVWKDKNRERVRSVNAMWRRNNPDVMLAFVNKRRARIHKAIVNMSSEERLAMESLYAKARYLTKTTGNNYHVDHIIPLSKGGPHHPSNLQILLASENHKKGARL